MKYNWKFRKKCWMVLYAAGLLIFSVSSLLRHELSDFQLGFCEGISMVLMLTGVVIIGFCLVKRENPFRL